MPKALLLIALLSVVVPLVVVSAQVPADPMVDRARRLLRDMPVIDGHNDYPWEVRQKAPASIWRSSTCGSRSRRS